MIPYSSKVVGGDNDSLFDANLSSNKMAYDSQAHLSIGLNRR
jgi:hypothetical protein